MNTPNPDVMKKYADARKAREVELASALANAKDTMPPTRGLNKKEALAMRNSEVSHSSPKDKVSRDRSSATSRRSSKFSLGQRSEATKSKSDLESDEKDRTGKSKGSKISTSSSRPSTASSADIRKERSSTSMTTRKNSSTQSNVTTKKDSPEVKKPFERPDHLTQRPFHDNDALISLKKELEKPKRGQFKREYRTNARQSGKSQISKKENI